ncbi:hypothetical protein B0H19DRAFT_1383378 [Mycena capillaripes]|nr:hypothetical protein B0H19DRAFT_1383378 [Mycena capillaripes]
MARQAPHLPKRKHNCVPSARIADANNNEALSADQQHALATKPILDLIKKIGRLSSQLPDSVPEPSDDDKVFRVITTLSSPDGTRGGEFNRRFDALFAEDCRDDDGRLENIRRGEEGMDCVVTYLESIHWGSANIPLDLAEIKLRRLAEALELLCVSEGAAQRPAVPTKKSQTATAAVRPTTNARGPAVATIDKILGVNTKKADKNYRPPRKDPNLWAK